MDDNDHTYEKIQKYLDNEMNPKEIQDFETEINSDQDLAREIKLNEDMKLMLADSPENELRKNLQILNNRVGKDPKEHRSQMRYLLWLLPIILAGVWYFSGSEDATNEPEPSTKNEIVIPEQEEQQTELETPKENHEEVNIVDKKPADSKPVQKQEVKPKPKTKPRPIAAAFEPNPSIEFLIENNRRDSDFELNIKETPQNVNLKNPEEGFQFRFSAIMKSKENLQKQDFKLHIFSNDKSAFQDFAPFSTFDLSLEKIEQNAYQIDYQKEMILKPGLYYYLLEEAGKEQIFFTEKFEVN